MAPPQCPGKSRQDYGTPLDFLAAVRRRFGSIDVDLAAREDNKVTQDWIDVGDDSLAQDWTGGCGVMWLNPPFSNIGPWAAKCAASVGPGRTILLLTPASIGANWFAEHVHGRAYVLALSPRLTFRGCSQPYPKDCMLSVYGWGAGFGLWRWK
jgi:phage N-6-adenine-methyltransferase